MRILIITNIFPYPPISGGALRNYNLLRRVAQHHEVWLASILESPTQLEGLSHLSELCQEVLTGLVRRRRKIEHLPGLLFYAARGWPLELKFRYSQELAQKVRQLCSQVDFDIIQIEESRMALYLEELPRKSQSKNILTFYDVAFAQTARFVSLDQPALTRLRSVLHSWEMRHWEARYTKRFDCAITVSEVDRSLLLGEDPNLRVEVIPNGVDTRQYQPLLRANQPPAIMFLGNMSYFPCIDAARYLIKEILPHVRRAIPEMEVWIVGADPVPEVRQLECDYIHVTGRVPDVSSYYDRSTVSVVPLRAGGGTRLKILEAMALGRPVVSTSIGCEGLDVINGEHLLVADRPEHFSEQIVCLFRDQVLYKKIVTNARRLVENNYDWDSIAGKLMNLYDSIRSKGQSEPI